MRIVICSATAAEIEPLKRRCDVWMKEKAQKLTLHFIVHEVGLLSAAVELTAVCLTEKPDLIIQAGVAGSFDEQISIGTTVLVKDEQLGDMGVEEHDQWKDVFDLGLKMESGDGFTQRRLINDQIDQFTSSGLPVVSALTVNQITTDSQRIHVLRNKYQVQIESMEGAALHYTCLKFKVPFLQVRSISNLVGERNKQNWNIPLAVENLAINVENILSRYINSAL